MFARACLALACLLAAPVTASAACPVARHDGEPLAQTAETLLLVRSTQVVAGGDIDLDRCAAVTGSGFVVEGPDVTLTYDDMGQGRALELRVEAACDTVLVVNTPAGDWLYNDDTAGTDPALRIEAAAGGAYDIWVGTWGMESCDARLEVEAF